MDNYPTKHLELFASQALEIFYAESISEAITNSDYDGEIEGKGTILNILTFGALTWGNYTGADMTSVDLTESNARLVTDQAKYAYFRVKNYDKLRSFVKNPEGVAQRQLANDLKKIVDVYVLGFFADAGAGNHSGTDYNTGTVTIDTSGNVTGSGTTFTSAMVGRPFKATGHSAWYRVKTFSSTTAIVIEDDSDDLASAYTGGAIGAGASFTIQAVSAVQVTKDTIFAKMNAIGTLLTNADIPAEDRHFPLPASIAALVRQAPEYISAGSESGRAKVISGQLEKMFAGFNVYEVPDNRFTGNTTDGFKIPAGHRSAICFAMALTENGEEPAIGNFGKKFKSLVVYGAKVPDERRKALAMAYWKL